MLYPNIRTRFDEPFTNTSYYTLVKERGSAQEGIYEITIIARAPARFTTAIGTSERFGTPVERGLGPAHRHFPRHLNDLENGITNRTVQKK